MSDLDKKLERDLIAARMNYTIKKFKRMADLCSIAITLIFVVIILLVSIKYTIALVLLPFAIIINRLIRRAIFAYPSLNAKIRKGKIDLHLPHAINMMLGMVVGGADVFKAIKTVAEAKNIFYELSEEFEYVCKLYEDLKMDFYSAILYVSRTTASERLSKFLSDLVFVLEGAGDITDFLRQRSEEYYKNEEANISALIDFLGLMGEVYLTALVVLPLFLLIILTSSMSFQPFDINQYLIGIVIMVPVGTIMLGTLVRSTLPITKHAKPTFGKVYVHARKIGEEKVSFFIDASRRKMRDMLKILTGIKAEPHLIDIRSIVALSLIIMALSFAVILTFGVALGLELWDIIAIIAVVSLLPAIVLFERKERIIRSLENSIPELFQDIATLNESGLTIKQALEVLSVSGEREINKEIRLVKRAIEWGMPLMEAFKILQDRIESGIVSRAIPVVVRSFEVSPSVSEAFRAVGRYTFMDVYLKRRIRSGTLVYMIIIYMAFAVFLYASYSMVSDFLAVYGNVTSSEGIKMGTIQISMDVEAVRNAYFYTSLIIGVFSGLFAGVLSEGKFAMGLKHSLFLFLVGYVAFRFFIPT
jgi:flagellar protein FlaJ